MSEAEKMLREWFAQHKARGLLVDVPRALLDSVVRVSEARGYARAREQAQEAVGEEFRKLDKAYPLLSDRRSGILDMHAAAAAALNAMRDDGGE